MKYVIIGNSAAAVGAIEGIRNIDANGAITVISDEPYHTYSRPLISYYLQNKTNKERMRYREHNFYEKNNCVSLLGRSVTKIDPSKNVIVLDNAKKERYDKLLLATGSSPVIPPIKGLENVKDKYTFTKFDDALAIEKAVNTSSRVLILGAGLIGLKCAEGLYERVGSIEVVDLAPRILSSVLDDESAAIVMSRIADKIKFRLNVSADRFEIGKAYFSDGTTTQFDVLVIAVGVRPNTLLLANCGGTLRRGIVVDDKQQTDIKDIYAAGDVCESYDTSSDQNKILAILPNAYAQGRVAGINMAGGNIAINDAIPLNALGLFGTHIVTAGSYSGNEIKSDKRGYKKLFMKDGTLKGYIIIDEIDKAGIYTALIRNRTPLSDEDIELIRVSPSLAAFSDAYRVQILSGASR